MHTKPPRNADSLTPALFPREREQTAALINRDSPLASKAQTRRRSFERACCFDADYADFADERRFFEDSVMKNLRESA